MPTDPDVAIGDWFVVTRVSWNDEDGWTVVLERRTEQEAASAAVAEVLDRLAEAAKRHPAWVSDLIASVRP